MGVTSSDIVVKQPGESITLTFHCANNLITNETISSDPAPTITATPTGLTIGTPAVNSGSITVDGTTSTAGQAVQATCSGGVTGEDYWLECVYATTESNTLEVDGILQVRDR